MRISSVLITTAAIAQITRHNIVAAFSEMKDFPGALSYMDFAFNKSMLVDIHLI